MASDILDAITQSLTYKGERVDFTFSPDLDEASFKGKAVDPKGSWITVQGRHIHLDRDGNVDAGDPSLLKEKDKKPAEKKEKKTAASVHAEIAKAKSGGGLTPKKVKEVTKDLKGMKKQDLKDLKKKVGGKPEAAKKITEAATKKKAAPKKPSIESHESYKPPQFSTNGNEIAEQAIKGLADGTLDSRGIKALDEHLKNTPKEQRAPFYARMRASLGIDEDTTVLDAVRDRYKENLVKNISDRIAAHTYHDKAMASIVEGMAKIDKKRIPGGPDAKQKAIADMVTKALSVPNPSKFDVASNSLTNKRSISYAGNATKIVQSILQRRGGDGEKQMEVSFHPADSGRAFYRREKDRSKKAGEVHLNDKDFGESLSVSIHELVHGVEMHVPGVMEACQAFLKHRVGDEKPTPMNTVVGAQCFREDEAGRKNNFDKAFRKSSAYYVGKNYGEHATEILTMGVQKLYEDPATFIQKDPEYAKFVMGVMSGHLRG